jgi:sugar/nucleoside kinase (ribokinase family)
VAQPSIGTGRRPTVLVVGAASRDLDRGDPRGWRLGGGVTYGSLTACRLGVAVRTLIGTDAAAAEAHELELLRRSGVELHQVRLARGPVFDNQALAGGGRRQVAHQASDSLPLAALPTKWRAPDAVVLNPVAGELRDEWAGAFGEATLVALDWQGLLRRLVAGRPVDPLPLRPQPLIARADLALVSAEDAAAGGAAIADLLVRPGQQLLVTHGSRGALLVTRHVDRLAMRHLPVSPVAQVVDATGAGDVALATWATAEAWRTVTGRRPSNGAPLAVALAAATLRVQFAGLDELPTLADLWASPLMRHA